MSTTYEFSQSASRAPAAAYHRGHQQFCCRLNNLIARSAVGQGWIERMQYADARASLWIDGELVHLDVLLLHDDTRDIRTPPAHRCRVAGLGAIDRGYPNFATDVGHQFGR